MMQTCRVCENGLKVVKHYKKGGKGVSYNLTAVKLLAEEEQANEMTTTTGRRKAGAKNRKTRHKAHTRGKTSNNGTVRE